MADRHLCFSSRTQLTSDHPTTLPLPRRCRIRHLNISFLCSPSRAKEGYRLSAIKEGIDTKEGDEADVLTIEAGNSFTSTSDHTPPTRDQTGPLLLHLTPLRVVARKQGTTRKVTTWVRLRARESLSGCESWPPCFRGSLTLACLASRKSWCLEYTTYYSTTVDTLVDRRGWIDGRRTRMPSRPTTFDGNALVCCVACV
ncbi:hypothetical protein BC567DRAFT_35371 [Phyllosticta citribraziliensis]